ncbi:glycosyl transferase group 1 [Marinitoga sp. 38H-ov]|nr:glycosyltransferase [Marinitoga sp. 38H-ov]KAF2955574.1 glycosyl transferase group 1 [Marinitoga sp. 38H-ov]
MNILIFSEMFPKKNNPSSGIFIIERLKELNKINDIKYDFIPISTEDNLIMKTLKKARNIKPLILPNKIQVEARSFIPLKVKLSTIDRLGILKNIPKYWIKYASKMANEIIKKVDIDYDIIHAHRVFPEGYAAYLINKKYNIPYIITAHGGEIHSISNKYYEIINLIFNNASKIIFVSEALRKIALNIFDIKEEKTVVIPNGYNQNIFKPYDKNEIRKELGIYKKNYNYVGFVGNLIPIKRADKLPDIFNLIGIKNTKFIVVGDGYLRNEIENKTKNLDILFTGRVSQNDVAKYMNAMDIMILPSRNEGWPCVVLEAQACGTDVIGSNNGGIPEAIGFEEYIVEDDDNFEYRFAKRVREVLKNGYDRNKIIDRAKEFTWENIVDKEINIYNKI